MRLRDVVKFFEDVFSKFASASLSMFVSTFVSISSLSRLNRLKELKMKERLEERREKREERRELRREEQRERRKVKDATIFLFIERGNFYVNSRLSTSQVTPLIEIVKFKFYSHLSNAASSSSSRVNSSVRVSLTNQTIREFVI